MRTNSIISDPEPTSPVVPALTGQKKAKPNDYEKIANSENYPQFAHYIRSRIDHFRQFTPGGIPVQEVPTEKRLQAWESAVTIIQEYEALLKTLEAFKRDEA